MLVMTSIGYQSTLGTNQKNMLANKRNIVTETLSMVFLMARSDVQRPRYLTSEPAEHTFGGWRGKKREARMIECLEIEDQRCRKTDAIFESNLAVSRNSQKGYQSTWPQFVEASRSDRARETPQGGEATVNHGDVRAVAEQLWMTVRPINNNCTSHMKPFLRRLGVEVEEMSPFCRDFHTTAELLLVYEKFIGSLASDTSDEDDEDDASVMDGPDDPPSAESNSAVAGSTVSALEEAIGAAMGAVDEDESEPIVVDVSVSEEDAVFFMLRTHQSQRR